MSAYVSLDGKHGFWVSHSFYETWLVCLAHHIELDGSDDGLGAKIVARWLFAPKMGLGNFALDRLPEIAAAPGGKEIMRAAVCSMRRTLDQIPDPFHNDVLALILPGSWDHGPVPQTKWRAMCAAFLDLLDGKITTKLRDKIDVLARYQT